MVTNLGLNMAHLQPDHIDIKWGRFLRRNIGASLLEGVTALRQREKRVILFSEQIYLTVPSSNGKEEICTQCFTMYQFLHQVL